MTIEQLLECSADELEKMTDKQLMDFFAPYLIYVKPDKTKPKQETKLSRPTKYQPTYNANIEKARAMAKQLGIEFDV